MNIHAIARDIRGKSNELGFDRVGFCDAAPPEEARHFDRWLAAGMHGEMGWIPRGRDKRLDPQKVLEGTRSLVVVAQSYAPASAAAPAQARGSSPPIGLVARYARGDDYHQVMGDRLLELEEFIEARFEGHHAMAYVDTGPVLERMWAARAGIGWVGKNSLILNKEMGSYFFLGVVLTTLPLPPDEAATDQCGSCTLCIEACPTAAIVEPRLVDSRRCISYHTIELRGTIPISYREQIGARVFGCDDCQEACPWNGQESAASSGGSLPARPAWAAPSLLELLAMTREEYLERYRGSAIKRAGLQGLRRNAAVSLGNTAAAAVEAGRRSEADGIISALEKVASDATEDGQVREHAAWAVGRVPRP